jgi:hypothetical protein
MDIKNELNISSDLDIVINKLSHEKEEIQQKLHIFKMLRLAEDISKLPNLEEFNLSNADKVIVTIQYDKEDDENYIYLSLRNKDDKKLDSKLSHILRTACRFPGGVNNEYINEDFHYDVGQKFEFDAHLKENLLNLFLSTELKAVLEYSEMDNELINNKEPTGKKAKI